MARFLGEPERILIAELNDRRSEPDPPRPLRGGGEERRRRRYRALEMTRAHPGAVETQRLTFLEQTQGRLKAGLRVVFRVIARGDKRNMPDRRAAFQSA